MRRRHRFAGVALLLASACSGDLLNLGNTPSPLVTLHGHVSGALGGAVRPRVEILWAGVPVYVPYCQDYGPNPYFPERSIGRVAAAGCRDPFDFIAGANGPSVALDAEQRTFELIFDALPNSSLLIGDLNSRVGYASLVVYDDLNGNGFLDTFRGCGRGGGSPAEPILASSFSSLSTEQLRLVYLEGALDAGSYFYPHPNCTTLPPPGFSLWRVGPLLPEAGDCRLESLEESIELTVAAPGTLDVLACGQRSNLSFERPPMMRPSLGDLLFECQDDGSIALVDKTCPCPEVRIASLQGCFDSLDCPNPDWDLRDQAPDWWPCEIPPGP